MENDNGMILLLHKNAGTSQGNRYEPYWDLPGGRIGDESVSGALAREIKEETGAEGVAIGELFDVGLAKFRPHGNRLVIVTYACRMPVCEIKLGEEHSEYKWFSRFEAGVLLKDNFPDSLIERLNR